MNDLQKAFAAKLATNGYDGTWWPSDSPRRFYFGDSAKIIKEQRNGKERRVRTKVWLEFDDPATLEGVALRVEAPKEWYRLALADRHAEAVNIAIEFTDPAQAARCREEIAAGRAAGRRIGDLVEGESEADE